MKVAIEWPVDKVVLLDFCEGIAKVRGITTDELMIDIIEKDLLGYLGGYSIENSMRERMEQYGIKEMYFPGPNEIKVQKKLEKTRIK